MATLVFIVYRILTRVPQDEQIIMPEQPPAAPASAHGRRSVPLREIYAEIER